MCKTAAICMLLSGTIFVPFAHADLLYDVKDTNFDGTATYEYTFTEPNFLTTTTTIPEADLTFITALPAGCTETSATINNPSSTTPSLTDNLTGTGSGCMTSTADFLGLGPFNHDGTYSNGAPVPTVLTISGSPVVPEPGSISLLLTAIVVLGMITKKRIAA